MADNNILIQSALAQTIDANGTNDEYTGTIGHSDIFIFTDGATGDDNIVGFNKNDSLVNSTKIFDGNGDGIISLGNELLDINRTSAKNAGADQISLNRDDGSVITDLRYLGTKDGQSQHVYADATVRFGLEAGNGANTVTEGLVKNDGLSGAVGNVDFLYDTALGLNLGRDTITSFTAGDRIVTTVEIFDSNHDGKIFFGQNGVLDLAGEDMTGGDIGPGGQIAFSSGINHLDVQGTQNIGGVDYYFYGLAVA